MQVITIFKEFMNLKEDKEGSIGGIRERKEWENDVIYHNLKIKECKQKYFYTTTFQDN